LNRLIAVMGGSINTQYAYDGDGNRVQQQISAGTYQYLNDVVTSLPAVLNEAGPDGTIDYARGLSLISESSQQQQYFYQFDGLGNVTSVTNEAGAHQANYGYDPWGQAAAPSDPPIGLDALGTKNKYRFTGELQDPNDSLLFLRARYYDAAFGRFFSRDTFGGWQYLPISQNRYQYAVANPLRFVDRSGFSAIDQSSSPGSSGPVGQIPLEDLYLPPGALQSTTAVSTPASLLGTGQSDLQFYLSLAGKEAIGPATTINDDAVLLAGGVSGARLSADDALKAIVQNVELIPTTFVSIVSTIIDFAVAPKVAHAPSQADTLPCSSIGCPVLTGP
jgi:RHS repeat-associated protein